MNTSPGRASLVIATPNAGVVLWDVAAGTARRVALERSPGPPSSTP
jgi:hypothetical protein